MLPKEGVEGEWSVEGHPSRLASGMVARMVALRSLAAASGSASVHKT
jgi:hypothetical protein